MKRTDFHSTACRNLGPLPYLYFAFQKRMPYRGPFKLFSKNLDFPVKVRPETSDLSVFYQIMIFDEYRCVAGLKSPELISSILEPTSDTHRPGPLSTLQELPRNRGQTEPE